MCTEKKFVKNLKKKHLWESNDLYVQSGTLLLADIFENFRNMCLLIYELDLAPLLTALRLAWQAAFQKDQSKIRSFRQYQYVMNDRKRY